MDWSYSITPIDGVFVLALSLLLGFEVIKNLSLIHISEPTRPY